MKFFSPRQAARLLNVGPATVHRHCQRHAGFAQWLDGRWRIPDAHINRILQGETAVQVARKPSLPADNVAPGSSAGTAPDLFDDKPAAANATETVDHQHEELRPRLLRAYLFALGLRQHDTELSDAKRQNLAWSISKDLLALIRTMGIVPSGGLRAAIRDADVLKEYRALTGIEAEI